MIQNRIMSIIFLSFIGFTSIISMDKIIESALWTGTAGGLTGGVAYLLLQQDDGNLSGLITCSSAGFIGFATADLVRNGTKYRESVPKKTSRMESQVRTIKIFKKEKINRPLEWSLMKISEKE